MIKISLGIDKVIKALESLGCDNLLKAKLIKDEAEAKAYSERVLQLSQVQTELDINDLRSGKKVLDENWKLVPVNSGYPLTPDGTRVEPSISTDEMLMLSIGNNINQTLKEEFNFNKTVTFAINEMEGMECVSKDDIDEDWFSRWRDCVKKVNNEQLQKIWARTLVGEALSPGTYSLRTLEFIKNISKKEAEKISKLAPFVMDDKIIHTNMIDDLFDFDYLLEMQDLGILSTGSLMSAVLSSSSKDTFICTIPYENKVIAITGEDPSKKIDVVSYKLTTVGKEILGLCEAETPIEYILQIADNIKHQGFNVIIGDKVPVDDDYFTLTNIETL